MITEPGVYTMPAETYLSDPVLGGSLSSSGARLLLRSCPAMYQHRRTYPDTPTAPMILGTAAHALILGAGRQPVEIPEEALSKSGSVGTNAAREFIANAAADGRTPMKAQDYRRVEKMRAAVRAHPVAGNRFRAGEGLPEQVLVWRDAKSGVMCRAMLDWLAAEGADGPTITDYKTADDASPEAFRRAVMRYRYDMQAAWYCDAVTALGIDGLPTFEFVVQETTSPYLVAVYSLDDVWIDVARQENRRAIDLYARCSASEEWPGYADEPPMLPPVWMLPDIDIEVP